MRRGQKEDAVLQILEATTLEPQISLYQSYLGKAFYAERKFEQAFTALQTAMELDPRDPTPHLYSGIFQEELNCPGVAVEDFQESIRLNDNRAVYRSRFVLDEDRATRNIKLASAFNRLGFSESANLEAIKSFSSDPTNSSARIFLADTFINLPGRSGAAGSELLMARLLLPVNANSFYAFNDYTTLFELPRLLWTGQLDAGNFDTYNQSLVASGGMKRVAFGSIFSHDTTDGFRPVNDDSRTFTTVNLFKFATTAHSDLLLSYSHTQTKEGDRGFSNFLVTPDNDENRRLFSRTNRAEIGYHHQLNPGSEVVIYFSGRTNEQILEDPDFLNNFGIDFALRRSSLDPNVSLQATHLFGFPLGLNEFELTRSTGFNLGWDQRLFEGKTFLRTTGFFRDRTIPTNLAGEILDFDGNFYGGQFVVQQSITEGVTAKMDYGITHDENLLSLRHQHNLIFGLFYIHHRGLFFDVEEEYFNQSGLIGQFPTKTNVWLTNASISYELPQKVGLLTFDVQNIFDRRYEFLSDPLSLDRRVPRRQVRFQFNVYF